MRHSTPFHAFRVRVRLYRLCGYSRGKATGLALGSLFLVWFSFMGLFRRARPSEV
jgi:hypothetical protein